MQKVIIVAAVTVLLIVISCILTMKGIGKSASVAPDLAASDRFQPGDTAILAADRVGLLMGDETVASLGKECRLSVLQVQGTWVGGAVQIGERTLTGWVHERHLTLSSRDNRGDGDAGATGSPPRGETLGQKFARLQAAEGDAEPVAAGEPGTVTPFAVAAESPAAAPAPLVGVHVAVACDPSDLVDLQSLQLIEHLVITGHQISNRSLEHLQELRILSLSVEAATVGNAGLLHVSHVKNLRKLRLWTPGVDDAGLEFVAKLNELEHLDLEGTSVRGAGLVRLRGLSKLSKLTLGANTQDDDLASLPEFSQLAELDLRSCHRLSEACLGSLAKVATLRTVWLPHHLVTGREEAIRHALPNCEVRL